MLCDLPTHFTGLRSNAALLAQKFIAEILVAGSVAVDATAGNGNDTLFLTLRVGDNGRVYAFDVQQSALEQTAGLLRQNSMEQRAVLIRDSHDQMEIHINCQVRAIMFNLGYLPGGDHGVTTRPQTTLRAVEAALRLLEPGGRLSIVAYTGHEGAMMESRAVEDLAAGLDPRIFGVLKVNFLNRSTLAPFLIFIERVVARHENLAT